MPVKPTEITLKGDAPPVATDPPPAGAAPSPSAKPADVKTGDANTPPAAEKS
jgi:hypothetical protein